MHYTILVSQNNNESSTKNKYDVPRLDHVAVTPQILPILCLACLISKDKSSPHNRNKYKLIGSPCQSPHNGWYSPTIDPLTFIKYLTVEMHWKLK